MAKRKKKSSKSKSRRSRVSGIGGTGMQLLIGAAVGAIGAHMATAAVQKNSPGIKDNMLSGGQLAVGALAALKMKNPMLIGVGLGLVGSGALGFGKSFGIVSGVGNSNLVTFTRNPQLNGVDSPIIAGTDLNDYDEDNDEMGGLSIVGSM